MINPFEKLYQNEKAIISKRPGNIGSAKGAAFISIAAISLFWMVTLGVISLIGHGTQFSAWFYENWYFFLISTIVFQIGYSFCRNLLDTTTAKSEAEAAELRSRDA